MKKSHRFILTAIAPAPIIRPLDSTLADSLAETLEAYRNETQAIDELRDGTRAQGHNVEQADYSSMGGL
jgi:hypothetical protein